MKTRMKNTRVLDHISKPRVALISFLNGYQDSPIQTHSFIFLLCLQTHTFAGKWQKWQICDSQKTSFQTVEIILTLNTDFADSIDL